MGGISGEDGGNIVTVIVNSDTGEVSVLSADRDADAGLVSRAAQSLGDAPEGFGELSQFSLSYYKENTAEGFKLALADASGLRGRIAGICLSLVLVYVFLMTAVFFISLGLSKLAAKPMESALEMERGFVADISHDLKTPITVILANNSILRSDPALADSRLSQWADSTETAAKSMMKLVEEMLTLSALESPRAKPEPVVCDLSGAAEKAALQLESVSYDRGVELETAIEPGIYTRATEEFLDRIAGGLIENALKYEPEGGKVTVTLTSAKKKAVFSVKNRLSRISPEDLPHVFERFYRSDKTRGDKKGFGLGLPIISRITALLGGSVTASSDREGTVFTVELPVCPARESGQVGKTSEV